jgi:hypothetical protein
VLAHFDVVSCLRSWGSIISKVRRLWFGQSGTWFPAGGRNFFFSRMFRLSMGPTCPLTQLVLGVFSPWVKWSGHDGAIHLHAVLGLRMSGAVSPLHCVLSWCAQEQPWSLILRVFDSGVLRRSGRK